MERTELESLIAELEAQEAELRFPELLEYRGDRPRRGNRGKGAVPRPGDHGRHPALGPAALPLRPRRYDGRQRPMGAAQGPVGGALRPCLLPRRPKAQAGGMRLEEKHFVDPLEFSAHGGAFPVYVKGTGLVGTITVSGLPQEDDHELVVECIREFLDAHGPLTSP